MTTEPISLTDALGSFDALWSPRILTRVNDYDVRVAKVHGEHIWHAHENTDEFFLVVDGSLDIDLRSGPTGRDERTVTLPGARSSSWSVASGTGRVRRTVPRCCSSSPPVRRRWATPTTPYRTMWTRRRAMRSPGEAVLAQGLRATPA